MGLAAAGLAARRRPRGLRTLAVCVVIYAADVLLYFVSDRCRAPLVPLLATSAAGEGTLLAQRDWRALVINAGVAFFCLWPQPPAESTRTFVQDYLALGHAHAELGEYREWQRAGTDAADYSPAAARLAGYGQWLRGDVAAAHRAWQSVVDGDRGERPAALAWLALTGGLRASDCTRIAREARRPGAGFLALVVAGQEALRDKLVRRYGERSLAREYASLDRLFDAGAATRGTLR
jgi:hypothetical protein